MSLAIFNGSPRGLNSNSKLLMAAFLEGFSLKNSENFKEFYLKDKKNMSLYKESFINADKVIFIFPLYVDAMPGVVKEFFETLEDYDANKSKKIGFIIHSGFPETIHSEFLAKYLERFVEIINGEYMGTVIKGGSESLKYMPEKMQNKTLSKFYALGVIFGEKNEFDKEIIKKLMVPYKFNGFIIIILKILNSMKIFDIHWNKELKKNNCYENRYDKPYESK